MTFQTFRDRVFSLVSAQTPIGKTIGMRTVQKNNGVFLTGIYAEDEKAGTLAPIAYLEPFYEAAPENPDCSGAAEAILKLLFETDRPPMDAAQFTDPDFLLEHTVLKLVNREGNGGLLKEAPHRPFLDLAAVLLIYLPDIPMGKGFVTVRRFMLERAGLSQDKLYEHALANTKRLFGECLVDMNAVIFGEEAPDTDAADVDPSAYFVLSNRESYFGATVLLYGDSLRRLSEKLEDDLLIIPASVHEVLVTRKEGKNTKELRELIRKVNHETISSEEVLSDSLYCYERAYDRVVTVE